MAKHDEFNFDDDDGFDFDMADDEDGGFDTDFTSIDIDLLKVQEFFVTLVLKSRHFCKLRNVSTHFRTTQQMTKTTYILTIFVLILGLSVSGQNLPTIKAAVHASNDFKKSDQIIWQKALDQYAKINSGDIDYEKISEQDKKMIDSLEMGYGPLTQGVGCSWYCGGGPYKITSYSYLKEEGKITYLPDNIHDFDLFTAWVPDNTNGSVGKKLNFHFPYKKICF